MQTPGQGPGAETGGSPAAAEDRGMPVVPGIRFLEIVVRGCANFATNFAKFRSEIAEFRYAALQIRNSRGPLLPPSDGGGSGLDLHAPVWSFSPQKTPTTMAPTKANAAHTAKRLILRTSVMSWPPAVSRYMKDKLPEPAGKAKKMLRCVAATQLPAGLVRNGERNRRFRPCCQSSFGGGKCSPARGCDPAQKVMLRCGISVRILCQRAMLTEKDKMLQSFEDKYTV